MCVLLDFRAPVGKEIYAFDFKTSNWATLCYASNEKLILPALFTDSA